MSKQLSFFEKLFTPKTKRPKLELRPEPTPEVEQVSFKQHAVQIKRRPYKRSMTLTIKPSGMISVSVGRSTPQYRIINFLKEHETWIEKNAVKLAQLRSKYPMPDFKEGCEVQFCGKKAKLNVRSSFGTKTVTLIEGEELYVYLSQDKFALPEESRAKLVRELVLKFFKEEGSRRLFSFVERQAYKMGVTPTRVTFRAQKSRWGSCSSKGSISLNWKLIVAPLSVQNYVVTHELAHLRHLNHSKSFWKLVSEYCPDYREAEAWLKSNHFEADFLSKESELHL